MKIIIKNPALTEIFNQAKVALLNNLSKKLNRHLLDEEVEFFVNYNISPTKGSSHQSLIDGIEPKMNNFFEPYRYNFSKLQAKIGRRSASSGEYLNSEQNNYCLHVLEQEFEQMLKERKEALIAYQQQGQVHE